MDYAVFLTLAPFVATATLAVGVAAWRRRGAVGGRELAAVAALATAWVVLNTLEVLAPTPEGTAFFARAIYVALSFLPAAWLAFALALTGRAPRAAPWALRGLVAVGLVTGALALTNDAHGLIWRAVRFERHGPFLGMAVRYGAWFWVYVAVSWGAVLAGVALVLRAYVDTERHYRRLSAWIAVGALVPVAANVLYVARVLPVAKDFSPIAFGVAAACFGLGLGRYHLLDLRPVARGALVDRLAAGVLVLDAQGRIVDANPAMERVLGVGRVPLGRPITELLPEEPVAALRLDGAEAEAWGEIALEVGGRPRHFDLHTSSLAGRGGAVRGRLVVLYDVTARHEAEAALQARNEELDAFAHTVAHDLKNPIQNVLGFSEILAEEGPDLPPEALRECATTVHRTALKMQTIVEELLLLAGVRKEDVTPAPLSMGDVVGEALDRLRPMIEAAGASVAVPSHWPPTLGHAPWVEEVWVNYVSNAVKYGGRPARVTLGAAAAADGRVRFWVDDEGPGPPAGADLFVPFTRLSQVRTEGHGLGLSIVRRIVERLGGTCGVERRPGGGSRFWFTLPAAAEAPAAEAAAPPLRLCG